MMEHLDMLGYWLVLVSFLLFVTAGYFAFMAHEFAQGAFTMATACFMLQVALLLFSIVDEEDDDDDWLAR